MNHSLWNAMPESLRHQTNVRGNVWSNPAEMALWISVYWRDCWISTPLHFLRKFPKEIHSQVWGFHVNQAQGCLLTIFTEPLQCFASSWCYFSLKSWKALQLLSNSRTSITTYLPLLHEWILLRRLRLLVQNLGFPNWFSNNFFQYEVNLHKNAY